MFFSQIECQRYEDLFVDIRTKKPGYNFLLPQKRKLYYHFSSVLFFFYYNHHINFQMKKFDEKYERANNCKKIFRTKN